jgi:integrase
MTLFEVSTRSTATFVQAIATRNEKIWQGLSDVSLFQAAHQFLETLQGNTQRAYRAAFHSIFTLLLSRRLFDPSHSLQTLALSNLEFLLDEIRTHIQGADATKQARAAAFIALTRYLQRATGGMIRKVVPRKEKSNPTFRQIRETSLTKALTLAQWMKFLAALQKISHRDYLLAKMILQGAKRVGEVLSAQISQIDWENNQITFRQLKSKELEKYTIITYPHSFMKGLREYIGERKEGFIFITRTGKPVTQPHLYRIFASASSHCKLPFSVHPHVLRASAITYLSLQGYHADQIIRVSGHADEKLVRYYDKTPLEQNLTREVTLI